MLIVVVVICVALLVAIFCREWGSPDDEGSGYMVKLKIVITHVQVLHTSTPLASTKQRTPYQINDLLRYFLRQAHYNRCVVAVFLIQFINMNL